MRLPACRSSGEGGGIGILAMLNTFLILFVAPPVRTVIFTSRSGVLGPIPARILGETYILFLFGPFAQLGRLAAVPEEVCALTGRQMEVVKAKASTPSYL